MGNDDPSGGRKICDARICQCAAPQPKGGGIVGDCELCGRRVDLWARIAALEGANEDLRRIMLGRYNTLSKFVRELARRFDEPATDSRPTNTKQVAAHLGRSPQWVRKRAPKLGGYKDQPGLQGQPWCFPPVAEVADLARSNGCDPSRNGTERTEESA